MATNLIEHNTAPRPSALSGARALDSGAARRADQSADVRMLMAIDDDLLGGVVRSRFTCALPALITLEILDALLPNNIRMAAKWDLIVAVKHFHDF